MNKPEHNYEIGQLVHFKSEDKKKRPHLITDVTWIDPFHEGEEGFYLYSLDDGSAAGREEILVPYREQFNTN